MSAKIEIGNSNQGEFSILENGISGEIYLSAVKPRTHVATNLTGSLVEIELTPELVREIAMLYNCGKFSFQEDDCIGKKEVLKDFNKSQKIAQKEFDKMCGKKIKIAAPKI